MCSLVSVVLYASVISVVIDSTNGIEPYNSLNEVYERFNARLPHEVAHHRRESFKNRLSPPIYPTENLINGKYQNEKSYSDQGPDRRYSQKLVWSLFNANNAPLNIKDSQLSLKDKYLMQIDRENRNVLLYQLASKLNLRKPFSQNAVTKDITDEIISSNFNNFRRSTSTVDGDHPKRIYEFKRGKGDVEDEYQLPEQITSNSDSTTRVQDNDRVIFPQSEIINKLQKMIDVAQKLNDLEEYKQKELLPEAQRIFADERRRNSMMREHSKWGLQGIVFIISVGTLMLFLIMVMMVLALQVHCRNREKTSQEWIRHPIVKPSTATSGAIQSSYKHILQPEHVASEPIRIKLKGLLERRGSNTSLTIDLGQGGEVSDVIFSPSRECTAEEFLKTAGSRMNRRQLRQCLKDPRDLQAEFWQIPTNHPDKCIVPGATAKNRYRTVLPNEKTRVVLYKAPPDSPETPASQYINCNYIRGYDGEEKAYIATQGPLSNTVEDLWLLVMQEKSPALIMITRLKEKGWVKCESYIPTYSATYGSIQVTVKQMIQKIGYTIRQIQLKRGDEVHTTLHFWFMSWPDHKTPSSARHILAMATEVENARKESQKPVIVHCSAGIGRTGCFIAVSIGRIQLLEEDCVDVLSTVCQMRLDRGGMVQTAEQYQFIHRALALFEASLPLTASSEFPIPK